MHGHREQGAKGVEKKTQGDEEKTLNHVEQDREQDV